MHKHVEKYFLPFAMVVLFVGMVGYLGWLGFGPGIGRAYFTQDSFSLGPGEFGYTTLVLPRELNYGYGLQVNFDGYGDGVIMLPADTPLSEIASIPPIFFRHFGSTQSLGTGTNLIYGSSLSQITSVCDGVYPCSFDMILYSTGASAFSLSFSPEQLPLFCGDGHLDPGEQCDDGNQVNGDGCSAACLTGNFACGDRDTGDVNGDGSKTLADFSMVDNYLRGSSGYETLSSNAFCAADVNHDRLVDKFDVTSLFESLSICGNNVVNEGEVCDGNSGSCPQYVLANTRQPTLTRISDLQLPVALDTITAYTSSPTNGSFAIAGYQDAAPHLFLCSSGSCEDKTSFLTAVLPIRIDALDYVDYNRDGVLDLVVLALTKQDGYRTIILEPDTGTIIDQTPTRDVLALLTRGVDLGLSMDTLAEEVTGLSVHVLQDGSSITHIVYQDSIAVLVRTETGDLRGSHITTISDFGLNDGSRLGDHGITTLEDIDYRDDGLFFVTGKHCLSTCLCPNFQGFCGNGQREVNEQCDDGNQVNGDGCSAVCQTEKSISGIDDTGQSSHSQGGYQPSRSSGEGSSPVVCVPTGAEVCDGKDNDCDGSIDNNLDAPACPQQVGVCEGTRMLCRGSLGWKGCNIPYYEQQYQAVETKCDGLDNDCDGQADEGCGSVQQPNSATQLTPSDDRTTSPEQGGSASQRQQPLASQQSISGVFTSLFSGSSGWIIGIVIVVLGGLAGAGLALIWNHKTPHEAPEEAHELEQYVKDQLQRGCTKEAIQKSLLDAGWDTKKVDKVLK